MKKKRFSCVIQSTSFKFTKFYRNLCWTGAQVHFLYDPEKIGPFVHELNLAFVVALQPLIADSQNQTINSAGVGGQGAFLLMAHSLRFTSIKYGASTVHRLVIICKIKQKILVYWGIIVFYRY